MKLGRVVIRLLCPRLTAVRAENARLRLKVAEQDAALLRLSNRIARRQGEVNPDTESYIGQLERRVDRLARAHLALRFNARPTR